MKNLITYENFINESHLPFEIERAIKQQKLKWEEDSERADEYLEDSKEDIEDVICYTATDKGSGREYVFITYKKSKLLYIELTEDEKVIFSYEYIPTEKKYYDQDCHNILGFEF